MVSNVTNVTSLDNWLKITDLEYPQKNYCNIKMNKYGKVSPQSVLSHTRLKEIEMFGMFRLVSQHI